MTPYDVVILGGGLAGLLTAVHLTGRRVAIVHPTELGHETSSQRAQGGIAAAMAEYDSVQDHIYDTLRAGAGYCEADVVKHIVSQGPRAIRTLHAYGVPFERKNNHYRLKHEAAHKHPRVVSTADAQTGRALINVMTGHVRRQNFDTFEGWNATEILQNDGTVCGVRLEHNISHETLTLPARAVVLATGSPCGLWEDTSVPDASVGAGLAMAWRLGTQLRDLEFVQFHPTATVLHGKTELLTEALRGAGAHVVDQTGRRFLVDHHPDAELAPRDVVARQIAFARQKGDEVFLDVSPVAELAERFPKIFDITTTHGSPQIPIKPCAHFHMGGVVTDLRGRTSVPGLWAVGEVARTGLHGANRLASNSLLEIAVTAPATSTDIQKFLQKGRELPSLPDIPSAPAPQHNDLPAIRAIMQHQVGVVRTTAGLRDAIHELSALPTHNATITARLIAMSAYRRRKSVGAHFLADSPT